MLYCLFEDDRYVNFLPLVHFRPVHDLICGALSLGRKWSGELPSKSIRLAHRNSLPGHGTHPLILTEREVAGAKNIWFINTRVLPDDRVLPILKKKHTASRIYTDGDTVVAALLQRPDALRLVTGMPHGIPDFSRLGDIPREPVEATALGHFWDLVRLNHSEIIADRAFGRITFPKARAGDYKGVHFLRNRDIRIGGRCTIKPGAVIDAEKGPVLIGDGVVIMPNAVVEGPAAIGDGSIIKIGAKIYGGTSIGRTCKVGGEVENSIIHPFSNKQHEGFLGHSCLGSWVNIGADTNTSDLKNTYGLITVSVGGVSVETGMQFLGVTMGDHSKTGINVMFDTGTVVGTCCNIYGAGIPPREIPSFSWGGAGNLVTYRLDKGLETMRRVTARRGVGLGDDYAAAARTVFEATAGERERAGVK